MFRLALNEGEIVVDDIEIHSLGLQDLRSKFSIIPQEPVLFSGTIRRNLDPFEEYPDHVLWKALDEVKTSLLLDYLTFDILYDVQFTVDQLFEIIFLGQNSLINSSFKIVVY